MTRPKILFIFDWDNTVILDNSDTLVFQKLAPEVYESILTQVRSSPSPLPWTKLIRSGLETLFKQGRTADEIRAAVADAPLPSETVAALRAIAAAPNARAIVLSDANTVFIRASLDKAELDPEEIFEGGIITNPAYEDSKGMIVLKPYIPEDDPEKQHSCNSCGKNLCKGEVLDNFMQGEYAGWRVVYVGDGGNDYCPVMRMGAGDLVLARKDFRLHKKIVAGQPEARVKVWDSAKDLQSFLCELL